MLSGVGHSSDGSVTGSKVDPDKGYFFDCVGWVSFAVHNCSGLGASTFTYFKYPGGSGQNGYQDISSLNDLKPGDILSSSGHVMMYVGDVDGSGKPCIIHCTGHGYDGMGDIYPSFGWGLVCEYYEGSSWQSRVTSAARVTDSALSGLDASS